jgi:hypothetical protein
LSSQAFLLRLLCCQFVAHFRLYRINRRFESLGGSEILLVETDLRSDDMALRIANAVNFKSQTAQDVACFILL